MPRAIRSTFLTALLVGLGLSSSCASRPEERWPSLKREIRERYPAVSQVSTDELAAWLAGPAGSAPLLLDARAPAEFEVSHLAGARLAPDAAAAKAVLADVPRDRRVVVYCSVGYRSSALAEELTRAGYSDVHNLEGSIFAWANEGRPLVRAGGVPTRGVHPFDAEWGQLLEREHWEWPGEAAATSDAGSRVRQ